jgi:magnesium-transporting ATPase (P-type)
VIADWTVLPLVSLANGYEQTRANSGNPIRPKHVATVLLVVGALGILKTVIESIHTTIENGDLILATFYYIGEVMVTLCITFCITFFICVFPTAWVFELKVWSKFTTDIHETAVYNVYIWAIMLLSVSFTVFVTFTNFVELQKLPDHYNSIFAILSLSIGAAVVFALCAVIYLAISALASENSGEAG